MVDVERRDGGSGQLHTLGGTEGAGADSLDGQVSEWGWVHGDATDLYDYPSCIHDGAGGLEEVTHDE